MAAFLRACATEGTQRRGVSVALQAGLLRGQPGGKHLKDAATVALPRGGLFLALTNRLNYTVSLTRLRKQMTFAARLVYGTPPGTAHFRGCGGSQVGHVRRVPAPV